MRRRSPVSPGRRVALGNYVISGRRLFQVIRISVPVLAALFAFAGHAAAQNLNFAVGGSDEPIEITSENGIEWKQDNLTFIARGNARATRGKVSLRADVLRAYYRELKGGGTYIWRIDAEGGVKIASPGEVVSGDTAIYDVDNSILVVKGKKVTFTTDNDQVTADK